MPTELTTMIVWTDQRSVSGACAHILLGLVWWAALTGCARALRVRLQSPAARRVLDRITGTVIIGLGLRLAMTG
ncbi:LysE family transporter [Streptomyces tibetensis]|uniref:LysE family transporter n=1 Tax=Streptomyces tibetensis TaxID=2382123 RepID=UPI0033E307EF